MTAPTTREGLVWWGAASTGAPAMTPLAALIERLEKAEAGSRELDAEIAVAVFETVSTDDDLVYGKMPHKSDQCAPGTFWIKSRSGLSLRTAEPYTTSIDAALTLVPGGWTVAGIHQTDGGTWWAELREGFVTSFDRVAIGPTKYDAVHPALALCIAALKARGARHD